MTTKDKQQLIKKIQGMKQKVKPNIKSWLAPDYEIPIYNKALDSVIELIKETNPSKLQSKV